MKKLPHLFTYARDALTDRRRLKRIFDQGVLLARQGGVRALGAKLEEKLWLGSGPPGPIQYAAWVYRHDSLSRIDRAQIEARMSAMRERPRFTVLLAGPPASAGCLESLRLQLFPATAVHQLGAGRDALQTALVAAAGTQVVLAKGDQRFAHHALYRLAEEILARPGRELILYSDQDLLDSKGRRRSPWFKTDWNPDLFLSQDFISPGLACLDASFALCAGGFRSEYGSAQNTDLLLRCAAAGAEVAHLPAILIHSAPALPDAAGDDLARAVSNAAPTARVSRGLLPGSLRLEWPLGDEPPWTTVIVPTRDGGEVLERCLRGLQKRTDYPNLEIIVVDNQSRDPRTFALLESEVQRGAIRLLRYDKPFNYSAINNEAARQARGSVLCLLNDDVEPLQPGWLREMVAQALRPEIGAVGALLRYPDGRIQHAGVGVGLLGLAGHFHKGLAPGENGYFGRAGLVQNVSAVTAACLVIRRETFERVGGFDEEQLPIAMNDVDLCLKVLALGLRNLWTPYAELMHHESYSRGADDSPEKRDRADREAAVIRQRWGAVVDADPSYNRNLSVWTENFGIAWPPRTRKPWKP